MTKNITLRLDEAVLRQAKHRAVEADCSLSEWVAKLIAEEISGAGDYAAARARALKNLDKGFHLGGKPLTRDEAHER